MNADAERRVTGVSLEEFLYFAEDEGLSVDGLLRSPTLADAIQSALEAPFRAVQRELPAEPGCKPEVIFVDHYPGVSRKAAALVMRLLRLPLPVARERIAMLTVLSFLARNGYAWRGAGPGTEATIKAYAAGHTPGDDFERWFVTQVEPA